MALGTVLVLAAVPAHAQTTLNGQLHGQSYMDDKIRVVAPPGWTIESSNGAILRKGHYVLSLCSNCGQASGIRGGRFSEIARLVQPWARKDEPMPPCGKLEAGGHAGKLDRQDLYYTRHVGDALPANQESDWCVIPKTHKTLWYGSFFVLPCTAAEHAPDDCGGNFLLLSLLTGRPNGLSPVEDEMAFGLTYETNDVDTLPEKGDRHLAEILREASAIVASVAYR